MKTCRICNIDKEISEFYPRPTAKDGVRNECCFCWSVIQKNHYQKNRVERLQKAKLYRDNNQEACRQRSLRYAETHREEARTRANKWYIENTEKHREYNKKRMEDPEYRQQQCKRTAEYTKQHREHYNAMERKRRQENPVPFREASKRYKDRHPETAQACCLRRRFKKRTNSIGLSKIEKGEIRLFIKNIRSKPSFECSYCHETFPSNALHIDHKQPIKLGGKGTVDNLTASCQLCNLRKGAMPWEEWQDRLVQDKCLTERSISNDC